MLLFEVRNVGLELAIAYQYSLSLVQNTTFGGNEITKKPIVTPGGAEGRIQSKI
ncbi:hypothetical protein [Sphaerospermopsis torques-reginae]|uniref:Uncharacterized protein n=1 Tax=Sphaerospermopsis torques-reginae ITEP-024 TaxID=984208 RepID=A0ABX8X3R6_9CYAN|nr:hypothetical protein [Sphaerospermopsis torques-reginae]QYX33336.1 hypothetical protein K2F26_08465 [Sphaerospermopsis torques-reginae ITEP-024]